MGLEKEEEDGRGLWVSVMMSGLDGTEGPESTSHLHVYKNDYKN